MPHPYTESEHRIVDSYVRVHANGEQTHVVILELDDQHAAIAYDTDPASFQPIAAEPVAVDPTARGCRERTETWLQANPKGVAPGESDGVLSRLWSGLKRLDASATAEEGES